MLSEVLATYKFYTTVKVRFAETDANQHMSHVSAVLYMEQARSEYLESLDLFDMETVRATGKSFVLVNQNIDYRSQAYYNDTLRIYVRVGKLGRSSIFQEYVIVNMQTESIIATAHSTVVYFDSFAQTSIPLPADLLAKVDAMEAQFAAQKP